MKGCQTNLCLKGLCSLAMSNKIFRVLHLKGLKFVDVNSNSLCFMFEGPQKFGNVKSNILCFAYEGPRMFGDVNSNIVYLVITITETIAGQQTKHTKTSSSLCMAAINTRCHFKQQQQHL